MRRLRKDPRFREKFPDLAEEQEEEEERPWRVKSDAEKQQR